MPTPLTIIIPTLNAAGDLLLCLESLIPGLEAGLEYDLSATILRQAQDEVGLEVQDEALW
jgi:hypothetical protein